MKIFSNIANSVKEVTQVALTKIKKITGFYNNKQIENTVNSMNTSISLQDEPLGKKYNLTEKEKYAKKIVQRGAEDLNKIENSKIDNMGVEALRISPDELKTIINELKEITNRRIRLGELSNTDKNRIDVLIVKLKGVADNIRDITD